MSNPIFTPLPWRIEKQSGGTFAVFHDFNDGFNMPCVLAYVAPDIKTFYHEGTDNGNASLIGHAREMFKVLEDIAQYTGDGPLHTTSWQEIVRDLSNDARAIVQKINEAAQTGGSQS